MLASNSQKTQIKTLQKKIAMEDSIYKHLLDTWYGVESCKNLTEVQAKDFILYLRSKAIEAGVMKPKSFVKHKYSNLGIRDGYATPKQLRMLNAMWNTHEKVREKTDSAFESFLKNLFGIENLSWMVRKDVGKAKKAIENIK